MKIVRYDTETLILRPGGAGLIMLFGLGFAVAGIFMIGWLGTVNRLVCERAPRAQMQCRLERTLFDLSLETKELAGLRGARLTPTRTAMAIPTKLSSSPPPGNSP